ncbi:hypothetical protein KAR91_37385 [Candidatus Pacearchaeota archaeon]|nr:hypothetical protein [Candidatus Pacearchaeota archaeon]
MKTDAELAEEARKIVGATASDDDLKKAMDDLVKAEKDLDGGEPAEPTEVDLLEKALGESEDAMENLFKSDGEAGDDAGAGAAGDDDMEGLGKSELDLGGEGMTDDEIHEEMVKASEEFIDLRKSVEAGTEGIAAKLDLLQKSIVLLSTVVFKQAAVVGKLTKSVQDTVAEAGKKPVGQSKTVLGKGAGGGAEEPMEKSRTEIQAELKKAVEEGTIKADALSRFSIRNIAGLTAPEKKIIGLEEPAAA